MESCPICRNHTTASLEICMHILLSFVEWNCDDDDPALYKYNISIYKTMIIAKLSQWLNSKLQHML